MVAKNLIATYDDTAMDLVRNDVKNQKWQGLLYKKQFKCN